MTNAWCGACEKFVEYVQEGGDCYCFECDGYVDDTITEDES